MALGALTSLLPWEVLDGAIGKYGCREQRMRKLPAHVVVHMCGGLSSMED
ncbi:transposase domain-containing protein [Streptosporangium canum]